MKKWLVLGRGGGGGGESFQNNLSGGYIANPITVLGGFIKTLLNGGYSYRTASGCASYNIVGVHVASKMLVTH